MEPYRMSEIIASCSFPDWAIEHGWDGPFLTHPYLRVVNKSGKCNVTGKDLAWNGRKWRLSEYMTPSEIVQTAFLAVMTAVEHETREKFTYRGVTVMQPHRDLDMVVRVSREVSERASTDALADAIYASAIAAHPEGCACSRCFALRQEQRRAAQRGQTISNNPEWAAGVRKARERPIVDHNAQDRRPPSYTYPHR